MRYKIDLIEIKCLDENDSGPGNNDEPYVIVTSVCFKNALSGVPLPPGINLPSLNFPIVVVNKFGPWGGVDEGETRSTTAFRTGVTFTEIEKMFLSMMGVIIREPIWGVNRTPTPIGDLNSLFFLVAMMEKDDNNPSTVRTTVQGAVSAAASGYANANLSRNDLSQRLRDDMRSGIILGITSASPNSDDLIGVVQELQISSQDLRNADQRGTILKTLDFRNPSTRYEVVFRIQSLP